MVPYELFLILSCIICVVVAREGPGQGAEFGCAEHRPLQSTRTGCPHRSQLPASLGEGRSPRDPCRPWRRGLRDRARWTPGPRVQAAAGSCWGREQPGSSSPDRVLQETFSKCWSTWIVFAQKQKKRNCTGKEEFCTSC